MFSTEEVCTREELKLSLFQNQVLVKVLESYFHTRIVGFNAFCSDQHLTEQVCFRPDRKLVYFQNQVFLQVVESYLHTRMVGINAICHDV